MGFAAFGSPRFTEKPPLSPETADVLAAYVVPANAWYLIPVEKIKTMGVYISPLDDTSVGKYEPWREAWCVCA